MTKTPKIVALAALYVAGKYLDENLTDSFGEFWRESYEPHEREIHGTTAVLKDFHEINIQSEQPFGQSAKTLYTFLFLYTCRGGR